MAAVRKGAFDSPGTVFGPFELRAPTDVMAITSLPKDHSQSSGIRFPFAVISYPLIAATCLG